MSANQRTCCLLSALETSSRPQVPPVCSQQCSSYGGWGDVWRRTTQDKVLPVCIRHIRQFMWLHPSHRRSSVLLSAKDIRLHAFGELGQPHSCFGRRSVSWGTCSRCCLLRTNSREPQRHTRMLTALPSLECCHSTPRTSLMWASCASVFISA